MRPGLGDKGKGGRENGATLGPDLAENKEPERAPQVGYDEGCSAELRGRAFGLASGSLSESSAFAPPVSEPSIIVATLLSTRIRGFAALRLPSLGRFHLHRGFLGWF
jgi:hypothetical protein